MLSRRDKLLRQPWEDRRYKDHRFKVQSALPAIDSSRPPARPHVVAKLKMRQREQDRKDNIVNENFSLLQRLNAIMKLNRLDNHWKTPLPNFHHKVGLFYEVESLNSRVAAVARSVDEVEGHSYCNVKCFACDLKKKTEAKIFTRTERNPLPSIY